MNNTAHTPLKQCWLKYNDCKVSDLEELIANKTKIEDHPKATEIIKNVPIYDADKICLDRCTAEQRKQVMQEWINVFKDGAGVIVIRGAFSDKVTDKTTHCFN